MLSSDGGILWRKEGTESAGFRRFAIYSVLNFVGCLFVVSSAWHGFVNPRGYPGTGMVGMGTGTVRGTRTQPVPVARIWWVLN